MMRADDSAARYMKLELEIRLSAMTAVSSALLLVIIPVPESRMGTAEA